jgi:hypothetical protein
MFMSKEGVRQQLGAHARVKPKQDLTTDKSSKKARTKKTNADNKETLKKHL